MKFYTLLTILLLCLALKSFGGTYRTPVFATAEVKPWGLLRIKAQWMGR